MNCEGEETRPAKDSASECSRTLRDTSLCENSASTPSASIHGADTIRAANALVVSKSEEYKGDVQTEIEQEFVVNNRPLELSNSNSPNRGHKSLVSCDYADYSDSSD